MERKKTARSSKGSGDASVDPPQQNQNPGSGSNISSTPVIVPVAECRRSSRKKIIKFDVRDLLNKNRKPHKIQIEARIDSNAPTTSKAAGSTGTGEATGINAGPTLGSSQDLSSKQKTFMEKSAIFRRFSVSQEQTKPPPPPPIPLPPTILSKVGEGKDTITSINAAGKRLSRTQEYYNNALLKPKQTTSLIVAQVESSVRSAEITRKNRNNSAGDESKILEAPKIPSVEIPQQKRRGRPPKARAKESSSGEPSGRDKVSSISAGSKGRNELNLCPEKATNWKEYKACLAQRSVSKTESSLTLKGTDVLQSMSILENTNADAILVANKDELKSLKCGEIPASADVNSSINVSVAANVPNKSLDITEQKSEKELLGNVSKSRSENVYLEGECKVESALSSKKLNETDEKEIISPILEDVDEPSTKEGSVHSLPDKEKIKNPEVEESVLETIQPPKETKDATLPIHEVISETTVLKYENVSTVVDETTTCPVDGEKPVNSRRTSCSSISDNSNHTCVSSTTAASYGTSESSRNFKNSQSSSSETSSSDAATSKETSSSSPDLASILIKRSKRLQRKANFNKNEKKVYKLDKVHYEAGAAIEEVNPTSSLPNIKSSNDSENPLSETNINLVENISLDSSSTGDVIPDDYKCELRTSQTPSESDPKDNKCEDSLFAEENDSNDSQKSLQPKSRNKVTKPRKSSRNRMEINKTEMGNLQLTSEECRKKEEMCDQSKELTSFEENVHEGKNTDIKCTGNNKIDSKVDIVTNTEVSVSISNELEETASQSTTLKEIKHIDNKESVHIKPTEKAKSFNEKLSTEKRKSLRNQKDELILQNVDANEPVCEASNRKYDVAATAQKEENVISPKELVNNSKQNVDEIATSSKRKYFRNQKNNSTSSCSENESNEATTTVENVITKDEKIQLKNENKASSDKATLALRKSLKDQKDDCTVSHQEFNEEEIAEQCKVADEIEITIPTQDNSRTTEQTLLDDSSSLATRKSLRKQKDDVKVVRQKLNEDEFIGKCETEEDEDITSPHGNSQKPGQKTVDNNSQFAKRKSLRKQKDSRICSSPITETSKNAEELPADDISENSQTSEESQNTSRKSVGRSTVAKRKSTKIGEAPITLEDINKSQKLNINSQSSTSSLTNEQIDIKKELPDNSALKKVEREDESFIPLETEQLENEEDVFKISPSEIVPQEESCINPMTNVDKTTVRKSLRNQKCETSSPESVDISDSTQIPIDETLGKTSAPNENQDQSKKIAQEKSFRNQNDDSPSPSENVNNELSRQLSSSEIEISITDKETFIETLNAEKAGTKLCPASGSTHPTEEIAIVKKKRTRKSRFKNLHGPDSDPENSTTKGGNYKKCDPKQSENDNMDFVKSSNIVKDVDNIESTAEANPDVKDDKTKILTLPSAIEAENIDIIGENMDSSNKQITELLPKEAQEERRQTSLDETSSQAESTNSYVIQNLSIETNTLLDILRTVQSNEEAAEEAKKAGDSATEIQISRQPSDDIKIAIETQISKKGAEDTKKTLETAAEVQISSEVLLNANAPNNSKSLKKLLNFNSNSPRRSASASPLTLKNVSTSPCRSNSSSPITLKKVNISPSRSDTSSPLALHKKLTRRYERRSRRGDDSPHKTLEETFAEIAALSSQAVLGMSTKSDVTEKVENVAEEIPSADTKEPSVGVNIHLNQFNTGDENESEFQQNNALTPTRKSKQSKIRSSKAETPVSGRSTSSCSVQESLSSEYEILKESVNPTVPSNVATLGSEKTENIEIKIDCNILTENENNKSNTFISTIDCEQKELNAEADPKNKQNDKLPELKTETDNVMISNAQETPSVQKISENAAISEESTIEETEECKSSKSNFKKRDTAISKIESKSSSKKLSKKTKIPENTVSAKLEENVSKISTTPPKRGRKPKTTQPETLPSPSTSNSGKKKFKKEQKEEEERKEETVAEMKNELETDSETLTEEKMAKKKRQRKLKEAFEAALNDQPVAIKDSKMDTPSSYPAFGYSCPSKSPPCSEAESSLCEEANKSCSQSTTMEPEEDPDPLKDIEKFIEDGVNLLKKDYKIDDDSVDNVLVSTTHDTTQREQNSPTDMLSSAENEPLPKEIITTSFETPADTPIATPNVTPPPKSPESSILSEENSSGGVRRSHRIKLITKTPKALVGRGLVRDKERFSIKDDVETKSHYTLDDHLLDLAEVEAKNAKFLKEMEERLSNFQVIKENEYKCERVISKEARKMICDCFLTPEEEERGELACGEDCLNRLLMIECGPECNVKDRCTNKRFQKLLCSPCRVFRTEKKGFGIMADIEILPGEFIMEYVGEVIDTEEFEGRRIAYSQDKNRHYYFMALRSDAIIDATIKGNISRFINHSCDPNAETQKWTVNGELRIGFFSRKSIMPGEEITFDYQYQRYGREAQRCYCESVNCRGWIGQEPNSDEGEQIDDDDESDEDEDEEEDNSNLLEEDDEDSDASVSDPEEVQKKLEMAAAQAAAELAPIHLEEKSKNNEEKSKEKEETITKPETEEEDSKSKFKKLLSKMAEKVAAKHKQTKREQKLQRKKKSKEASSELANKQRFLEDPDIEDEVEFLSRCGLKNQSDTLRLSRLMVRAKLVQTRLNLLEILRKGELPCRRLFLDYHGLRLVHGWMSEDAGNMQIRLALLQTLELLPIANKTVLTDSKVMQVVRNWCGANAALSPSDDSLSSNSNSQDASMQQSSGVGNAEEGNTSECAELQKLALKLITTWDSLPEIFRIPKKERIEQMKEHEREADRQYAETEGSRYTSTDSYKTNRFGKRVNTSIRRFGKPHCPKQLPNLGNAMRSSNVTPENLQYLSKAQRREMFAAKVARDEAEKRMAEERREFETKCRFFGLDPKKTRLQDIPFCVNPATGQWYSVERKPISTPPNYAHVQVPVKPKSTNPADYQLPAVCGTLPPQWKYAITPLGQIYYYHVQYRVPQWEPPTQAQLQHCEMNAEEVDSGNEHTPSTGPDSSDDDDDILIGMDAAQLKAYIDRKVEIRRQKRYQRLVGERAISPRREEDRVYNQLEVRKYKENKEKIRKRKEEIRRKRAEALRQTSLNMCTLGSLTDSNTNPVKSNETEDEIGGALPIQDYLLSSDEDDDIKVEVNSPLIDKIVEGDKIVDELDALTTKRQLKRPLPPHRDLSEPSSSSTSTSSSLTAIERQEYKKRKLEKKDKRKPKEQDAKYRRTKEKFRCEIAGIIVHHLKPYRKDSCMSGRIQSNEDFNHLARKLTHFVMIKELKYCESVGQTLVVTESVKNKSREFIKKYMTKYGDVYVKPANDPEFKDIPFTL